MPRLITGAVSPLWERAYYQIVAPEKTGDRESARGFWMELTHGKYSEPPDDFVRGFLRGARKVIREVDKP